MPDHLTTEEKGIIAALARVDTSMRKPLQGKHFVEELLWET
jgi:hypothetical protein